MSGILNIRDPNTGKFTPVTAIAGVGVPAKGTTGQILTKISDADYDTQWKENDASKLGGKTPEEYATAEEVNQLKSDIGDAWVSGKTYAVGDYCISGNQLYKCKTAHTAGSAFAASYWEAVSVADMLKALAAKTSDVRLYSSADFSSGGDAITIDSTTYAAVFGRVAVIFLRFTVNSSDGYIILPFSSALQSKQYFALPEIWSTNSPNLGWFSLFSNKIFATSSMVYGKTYSGMFTTIV